MTDPALWVELRQRRRELGIGTDEAAAMCGVTQASYSRWENGLNRPGDEYLDGIASYLGIPRPDVVLLRSGEAPRQTAVDRLAVLAAEVAAIAAEVAALRAAIERLTEDS